MIDNMIWLCQEKNMSQVTSRALYLLPCARLHYVTPDTCSAGCLPGPLKRKIEKTGFVLRHFLHPRHRQNDRGTEVSAVSHSINSSDPKPETLFYKLKNVGKSLNLLQA